MIQICIADDQALVRSGFRALLALFDGLSVVAEAEDSEAAVQAVLELRADHYFDYLNQPRYTAVPSMDPDVIDFQFREAIDLDTHPTHFHGSRWNTVDTSHLIQGAAPILTDQIMTEAMMRRFLD